jgi:hypothetical protein
MVHANNSSWSLLPPGALTAPPANPPVKVCLLYVSRMRWKLLLMTRFFSPRGFAAMLGTCSRTAAGTAETAAAPDLEGSHSSDLEGSHSSDLEGSHSSDLEGSRSSDQAAPGWSNHVGVIHLLCHWG